MDFQQMLEDDLDLFYTPDCFATSATYKDRVINVLLLDELEVMTNRSQIITAKSSDVENIAVGESITIKNSVYEISNFDYKDSTKLEMIISLSLKA